MLSKDLSWVPDSPNKKRELLKGLTGRLLHEIGHTVAAAKQGYPTDLIILDQRKGSSLDCAFVHDSFRAALEENQKAQVAILAGGFMAEYVVFSEVTVLRAVSDIMSLCTLEKLQIKQGTDDELISVTKLLISKHRNLFSPAETKNIKVIYSRAAELIKNGKALKDEAFIIPIGTWVDLIQVNNHNFDADALKRVAQENYSLDVLEELRGHSGKSGV